MRAKQSISATKPTKQINDKTLATQSDTHTHTHIHTHIHTSTHTHTHTLTFGHEWTKRFGDNHATTSLKVANLKVLQNAANGARCGTQCAVQHAHIQTPAHKHVHTHK